MEEQAVNNQVQQVPVNPVPISKKPNQWTIAAIVLVVIVIIGSIFTLLLNSQKSSSLPPFSISPTLSPITDPTANWKTYKNEEFGFEVRYPADIFEVQTGQRSLGGIFVNIKEINHLSAATEGMSSSVSITASMEEGITDLDAYLEKIKSENVFLSETTRGDLISNLQKTIFNGYDAYQFNESIGISTVEQKILLKSGVAFQISKSLTGTKLVPEGKIHDQILSTFKFTSALPTGGDQGDQVVCAQDVKECLDGSYVSRQGPNCEFAKCP